MKALERYVKKNGKAFGKSKSKGSMKNEPTGEGQKASATGGKKITDDSKSSSETDPSSAGIGAYESIRGYKGKKKKQRSYLNC